MRRPSSFAGDLRQVFIGKIDGGFQKGQEVENLILKGLDFFGKAAGALPVGNFQGTLGLGLDQIDHGFGLGRDRCGH